MKISTPIFGEIEIKDEQMIRFPGGIPGFEEMERFALVDWEGSYPFAYLISIDEPEVSFLTAEPFVFFKDYEFELSQLTQDELEVASKQDVMVRVFLSVRTSLEDATANLMAPIVINTSGRIAKQVVLHQSPYTTKHPLFAKAAK